MNFIYHFVPKVMRGDILYPLNTLKNIYPDLFEEEAKKYEGREFITAQKIPVLDCLWNDVLHFAAVHPQKIKEAFMEAGGETRSFECFEIDPAALEAKNSIVYLYRQKERGDKLNKENFEQYDLKQILQYDIIPDETKNYYRSVLKEGGRPLLFHRIPHILYKGNLDVQGMSMVKI